MHTDYLVRFIIKSVVGSKKAIRINFHTFVIDLLTAQIEVVSIANTYYNLFSDTVTLNDASIPISNSCLSTHDWIQKSNSGFDKFDQKNYFASSSS